MLLRLLMYLCFPQRATVLLVPLSCACVLFFRRIFVIFPFPAPCVLCLCLPAAGSSLGLPCPPPAAPSRALSLPSPPSLTRVGRGCAFPLLHPFFVLFSLSFVHSTIRSRERQRRGHMPLARLRCSARRLPLTPVPLFFPSFLFPPPSSAGEDLVSEAPRRYLSVCGFFPLPAMLPALWFFFLFFPSHVQTPPPAPRAPLPRLAFFFHKHPSPPRRSPSRVPVFFVLSFSPTPTAAVAVQRPRLPFVLFPWNSPRRVLSPLALSFPSLSARFPASFRLPLVGRGAETRPAPTPHRLLARSCALGARRSCRACVVRCGRAPILFFSFFARTRIACIAASGEVFIRSNPIHCGLSRKSKAAMALRDTQRKKKRGGGGRGAKKKGNGKAGSMAEGAVGRAAIGAVVAFLRVSLRRAIGTFGRSF